MPLLVELLDAAPKIKNKFMYPFDAEEEFEFGPNLGDFNSTGIISNDNFESIVDGNPVIKHFQNMTINAGRIVKPANRCRGMFILIEGDLTVNGILSMSGRGAKALSKFVGIDYNGEKIYFNDTNIFSINPSVVVLDKIGGAGGEKVDVSISTSSSTGKSGNAGSVKLRSSGGGGGGAAQVIAYNAAHSGPGAAGTVFSGGSGGGGAASRGDGADAYGQAGVANGGAGGDGGATAPRWRGRSGGTGGAGNGPGANAIASYSTDGYINFDSGYGQGTGGLMILIVKGNILVGSTGRIDSDGVRAPGVTSASDAVVGTGGGSGGGIVMIMHQGLVTNNGIIRATGGLGGATPVGYAGGKGGDGHVELLPF